MKDMFVVFAWWNFSKEIIAKAKKIVGEKTKFIIAIPEAKIL